MNGKQTCKYLKELRRRIADDNGIPLDIPQCTYEGPCSGTCPRCEAEARYLEEALAQRLSLGKAAAVAGIALALAAPAAAQNVLPPDTTAPGPSADSLIAPPPRMAGVIQVPVTDDSIAKGKVVISGTVTDVKTHEPIPFANIIIFNKEDRHVIGAQTDFDGKYKLSCIPQECSYMEMICVGYLPYRQKLSKLKEDTVIDAAMQGDPNASTPMMGMVIDKDLPIEIGDGGLNTEIQGVKVRIQ